MSVHDFALAYERKHGKPLRVVTAVDPHRAFPIAGRPGNHPLDMITRVHQGMGYASRRAYFWHLSQHYNVDVDVIQAAALVFGIEQDFDRLIGYVEALSPNRNRQ